MKKYYSQLIVILLIVNCLSLSAQHNCGTIDKIDPAVEYILSQNLENFNLSDSIAPIPIQFHVTRPSDGVSGFEPRFVDSILQVLELGFNNTPFEFYQCGDINYIDDDEYATIYYQNPDQDLDAFFNFYNSKTAINIYLANSIFAINVSAWAYFPWGENHSYVIPASNYTSNTHVHEMGHLLGLYHTHTPGDLADGSVCETKGDLCCDTPAEPQLNGFEMVDGNCEYIGNDLDQNGQPFVPDVGNHMSYARSSCRDFFTTDQIDRMSFYYFYYLRKFQCDDNFEYTDAVIYEINTFPSPAIEGQAYDLFISVRNNGNTKSISFPVEATMDGNRLGRKNIGPIFTSNPRSVSFADRDEFPHEAGRYLICAEAEGDSLEINSLNNTFCQEILIRQEAGIPDLAINNLTKGLASGNQNALNPLSFDLENLGNIIAVEVAAKVYVEDILVDSFALADIEVAEQITINLMVPLGPHSASEVCIEMAPAFTEERLDNNRACINYTAQDSLIADVEIDSISLVPDDAMMIPGKIYQLYYRYTNNGPAFAYNNMSYLVINDKLIDSTDLNPTWAYGTGVSRLDSFHFILPWDATSANICAEIWNYRDTLLDNNRLCLSREVEVMSHTNNLSVEASITIYPNPFDQVLNINAEEKIQAVNIYNHLGQAILSLDGLNPNKKIIDMEVLPSGVYYILVETEKNSSYKKVVKI